MVHFLFVLSKHMLSWKIYEHSGSSFSVVAVLRGRGGRWLVIIYRIGCDSVRVKASVRPGEIPGKEDVTLAFS